MTLTTVVDLHAQRDTNPEKWYLTALGEVDRGAKRAKPPFPGHACDVPRQCQHPQRRPTTASRVASPHRPAEIPRCGRLPGHS